ncbi:hypothetical protein LJC33_05765 [Eubacteriales bacterium OttesenSCG-928-N13]|nr:hypothetical protein [Eubacteriales bacterium OttesenSCG-928-N13]
MKRIFALCIALIMLLGGMTGLAEGRDLGEIMKELGDELGARAEDFGKKAGESLAEFGDQLKAFSEDPEAYIDQNELLSDIKAKAEQAGQSLMDYWPTFKDALIGSLDTALDSDMEWEQKKQMLTKYAEMAMPFLTQIDFGGNREQAIHVMRLGTGYADELMQSDLTWEQKQEMLRIWDAQSNQKLGEAVQNANRDDLTAAYEAFQQVIQSTDEQQAKDALAECMRLLDQME